MQHIFIIGSKGIPAQYGGFETFVEKLTQYKKNEEIKYHVACMSVQYGEFTHNNARCFQIKVPKSGSASAVFYDLYALRDTIEYIKKHQIEHPIVYILACRIGPFIHAYVKEIHKLGGILYINPDGHEWKRAKWNSAIKKYWKHSERLMIKHADKVVCDSKNIETYIRTRYWNYQPRTAFIAYGADSHITEADQEKSQLTAWYLEHGIRSQEYYLVVGRFVPENNYESMIREFMNSDTDKDLVLITNVSKTSFYQKLAKKYAFEQDRRIKFVGTVYDQELLYQIRMHAFAYLHGHEVGGTNPSLLEALAATNLNLLLGVGFNREVAENSALYWTKDSGNLCETMKQAEKLSHEEIMDYGHRAKERIRREYSWESITERYESMFLSDVKVLNDKQVSRIAMLGHKRIPTREGGIEIVVKELSTRMVQRGKRVTVYNRHRKKEPVLHEYMGVRLIETGAINMKGIEAFTYSIIATLRAVCGKFEVIHFHAEGPCAMIWLPHLLRIPTVATIHGLDWQRAKWGGFASWYIHLGEYMAVRHADRIIVLSRNVQRYFMETYHRETEFIENGIASMPYREADLITKKLGVKKDDYLLFLGRIVPEKGLHYLIEAFGQIKTDKKLIIAGASGQTDEYFEEIKKLLSKDERVQLAGFVEGAFLEELYSNCCYYVLPSDVEGMAISLLEAMSYGCNCLVSDIEENTEVTGEYAYTFSKGNVADLKEKLEYMLLHEKEINMPQKKQEIRAYIEEKYSWDHVVNETFKLYEAIQKRRNNK